LSDFSKLKRTNKADNLAKLRAQTEALDSKQQYKDERYWMPVTDKADNGSAIIRFLPGVFVAGTDDQEESFVRKWYHSFQNLSNKMWYIENNLNTLNNAKDPVTDYNSKLWKTEDLVLRKQVSRQKRKLAYISNIYVIKHPGRPEDEGKVFLYQYGQKIFDKIKEKLFPPEDEPDLESVDVFDFEVGANFRLRIKKVEGFRNYDSSSFDNPKSLADADEMAAIFDQQYSLRAEVAPDKFKSYADLKKRLDEVLGIDTETGEVREEVERPAQSERKLATATRTTIKVTETEEDPPFDVEDATSQKETVAVKSTATGKAATDSDFFAKLKVSRQKATS